MIVLLIPVKDPANGKTRLSGLLTPEERRLLAWEMFEDVAQAAGAATKPDRIVVVTSFERAGQRAAKAGFDVMIEESQFSESASVDWASRELTLAGADAVMRLPADVPLVTPDDVDELLSTSLKSPGALLVPSREGTGTNCIIRTPPDLFPSRFGPNSLALHQEEASLAGINCVVRENFRISVDIDEPADLELFTQLGHGTRTFSLLSEINSVRQLRGGA
jgi:2-phospho-L-lactate guanylyltransferase